MLFPSYRTDEFEATIEHLKNISAISIDHINAAVASVLASKNMSTKSVQDYFNDLEKIQLSDSELLITSVNTVFYIVLAICSIASCYSLFKICFTPSHNIKPFFPTFKPREWTKMSKRQRKQRKQRQADLELAPIRHEEENKLTIPLQSTSTNQPITNGNNYHPVKYLKTLYQSTTPKVHLYSEIPS